jgi:hypothetical protein
MEISWCDLVENKGALSLSKEERVILHTINRRNDKWVSYCLPSNCLYDILLKEGYKCWDDEEEDASRYWMTLRKREDTGN